MDLRWFLGVVVCLGLLSVPGMAVAASQGPFTGTAATQSTSPTQVDWTSVTSVLASDDARASVTVPCCNEVSERITISDLGFAIPPAATIDGIEVSIEKRGSGVAGSPTLSVFLYWDDGGFFQRNSLIAWGSTEETVVFGGPSDTWGSGRVPGDINDENLGLRLQLQVHSEADGSGTFEVDHVTMTVYYSGGTARESPIPAVPLGGLLLLAGTLGLVGWRLARHHRLVSVA